MTDIPAAEFLEPGAEAPEPATPLGEGLPRYIGLREIAQMLEVEDRTPTVWRDRSRKGNMTPPMPEPEFKISGDRPVWSKSKIIRWATKTGRTPAQRAAQAKERAEKAALAS